MRQLEDRIFMYTVERLLRRSVFSINTTEIMYWRIARGSIALFQHCAFCGRCRQPFVNKENFPGFYVHSSSSRCSASRYKRGKAPFILPPLSDVMACILALNSNRATRPSGPHRTLAGLQCHSEYLMLFY